MATIKAIIPDCPHTLELKNCKKVMGHDDTLFDAEVHLNGKRIGSAWNTGRGISAEYRLEHDVTDADKVALKEISDSLQKIQLFKLFLDTRWTLNDLFDVMAEKAIRSKSSTFTVETIQYAKQ